MSRWIITSAACVLVVTSAANANIIRGPGAPGTGTPPDAVVTTGSHASDFALTGANQQATAAVTLGAGQDFLRLTFWGTYLDNTDPADNFTLRIWGPPATAPGLPTDGNPPLIYNAVVTAGQDDYGTDGQATPRDYYQYTVDFTSSPIAVTQAGDYFISIVNDTTAESAWRWTSNDDDLNRYVFDSNSSTWFELGRGDLAFQSEHAPEPGSIGILSVAALGLAYGAWRRRKRGKQSED